MGQRIENVDDKTITLTLPGDLLSKMVEFSSEELAAVGQAPTMPKDVRLLFMATDLSELDTLALCGVFGKVLELVALYSLEVTVGVDQSVEALGEAVAVLGVLAGYLARRGIVPSAAMSGAVMVESLLQ